MTGHPDIGDVLDRLRDGGVLREDDDGGLATTDEFEETRAEYARTYRDADRETFVETVAEAFGLAPETAANEIAANGVTRAQLAAYLAVESFLDTSPSAETKAVMAHLVCEVSPPSPVPRGVTLLDDDSYEAFLDAHPDAVLTVWKRHCEPCERLKADLDDLLDAVPEGVAVGGLDGESASAFRLAHAVNSAPVVLWFRDGERVESRDGYVSPSAFADVVADVY
ncbi:thioredoxin domain-containing protein [Haloprofundus halobius]|uniref:thioredoxin domain-containing protein n=1 Tax=Haloprofundus halobius TaxID=2876194 RepID=UPI001CCCC1BC|nr:thioredoxin domain-containing protein [Haloprofundus halobius]